MKKKTERMARTIEAYYRQIMEEVEGTGIDFQGLLMPNSYRQMVRVPPSQVKSHLHFMSRVEQEALLQAVVAFHEHIVKLKTPRTVRKEVTQ